MELDVVLLPPKKLSRKIGNLVRAVGRKVPLKVAVDDRKLLPHVSLLHIEANQSGVRRIASNLGIFVRHQAKLKLEFTGFRMAGGVFGDFFMAGIRKSPKIYSIHKNVVEEISPLRSSVSHLPPKNPNELHKVYFKKYGVGNILKFFDPHITMGSLKNLKDSKSVLQFLSKTKFKTFTADRVALTKVDVNHQVTKIIKEFKLK